MASNHFGQIFRLTTWGESHGKAIGVVIDGCPAGLSLNASSINAALKQRAPGNNPYTSPRKEPDHADVLSGLFEGKTTGAPISIIIDNKQAEPQKYEPIKHLLRPGHANYTYLEKYGLFDYRGGGRASARETACRVAAGAVAQALLDTQNIRVCAYLKQIGDIHADTSTHSTDALTTSLAKSAIFWPDQHTETAATQRLDAIKQQGDSLGGLIECIIDHVPVGLGDPVYEKMEAKLANAMLSIPASKGFEIGEGFNVLQHSGATHNDRFAHKAPGITQTNHAGGTLGGITTGMPIVIRVAFKPTSSIKQAQPTVTLEGEKDTFVLPPGAKHDPCLAIRAVPVVKAMSQLVLADALLMRRHSRVDA